MKIATLIAIALGAANPAPTESNVSVPVNVAYQQLVKLVDQFYVDTGVSQTFRLKGDEQRLVSLNAPEAGHYVAVAVCDSDCGDLDMQAFDAEGKGMGEDKEVDTTPVLDLGKNQRSSVVLSMPSCENEEGCVVKVGLLKVR